MSICHTRKLQSTNHQLQSRFWSRRSVYNHILHTAQIWRLRFFPLSEIEKKKHLCGKRYRPKRSLGSSVYQFQISVPKEENDNCFKKWIKKLKLLVREYFELIFIKLLLAFLSEKTGHLQKFLNTPRISPFWFY